MESISEEEQLARTHRQSVGEIHLAAKTEKLQSQDLYEPPSQMKIFLKIINIAILSFFVSGCNLYFHRVNNRREKRALEIAKDLRENSESSSYYNYFKREIITEIESGIYLGHQSKKDGMEVRFYNEWTGPVTIINVKTGHISFTE